MKEKWKPALVSLAVLLALSVVMLGAYTRLTNAGLGCPDWPGCYGQLVVPGTESALRTAQNQFPSTPVETGKAWTEMSHRYAAMTLAILIFISCGSSLYTRLQADRKLPWKLAFVLMLLVVFQAVLGMWTVTMKLLPVVVMAHLLGGMLVFSCLCFFRLQLSAVVPASLPGWRFWIKTGLVIVFFQIALGGWVSSNYAGIACTGFPQCNGLWLPELDFSRGFHLFSPVGVNYQGGVLDSEARVTIQYIHRAGALFTAIYMLVLSGLLLIKIDDRGIRLLALVILFTLVTQFTLGIINVVYLLPLRVAVAHNGVAALLLAASAMLLYLTNGRKHHAA